MLKRRSDNTAQYMARSILRTLKRRLPKHATLNLLPPGFDATHYLALNPDVAAALSDPCDAARHYTTCGIHELHKLMPEGVGIDDREHRQLATQAQRVQWLEWLRRQKDLQKCLTAHPRAAWLQTDFNLASYLLARPDVAAEVDHPLQGAFHFLEFGLEEGSYGAPQSVDPDFLFAAYPEICAGVAREDLKDISFAQMLLRANGVSAVSLAMSEPEYWEIRGFSGSYLAQVFDHEWYNAMAIRAGLRPEGSTRLALIDHFCTQGAHAGLGLAADQQFDPSFYLEHWLHNDQNRVKVTSADAIRAVSRPSDADRDSSQPHDAGRVARREMALENLLQTLEVPSKIPLGSITAMSREGQRLYTHWLRIGLRKGCAANFAAWAKNDFGFALSDKLALRLQRLAEAAPDFYGSLPDRLTRLLCDPMRYLDHMPDLAPEEANALSAMGDKMAEEDRSDQAEWLYRTVLAQHPDHTRSLQHLAELMNRAERVGAEYQLRLGARALLDRQSEWGIWNALALAELALDQDQLHAAVDLLSDIRGAVAGNEEQFQEYHNLATRLFRRLWAQIGLYAEQWRTDAAQGFLKEVLALATPPRGPVIEPKEAVKRVALIANQALHQCKLYRVDQKAQQLREAGYDVLVFDQRDEIEAFKARAATFDAAIFYRVPAFPEIMSAITECTAQGLPSFYEIDDLVFDPTEFPPAYETYAGKITHDHYRDMACGVPLYSHAMALCDYGIGSTRVLRDRMAKIVRSGRAFEHRNALGLAHLAAIEAHSKWPVSSPKDPIVLFYGSGTLAHKGDFQTLLEPALARILRRYEGQVELRLVGSFGRFKHLDPFDPALRKLPPITDFEQYCMMVARADINLSVLSRTPVTDAKSEIKWLEAAMFAIPSVVSRTATHEEAITHGQTGFLCETPEDFERHISALIDDPGLRRRIGERARDQVMSNYDLTTMGQNLTRIFQSVRMTPRSKPLIAVVNVFYPPQAIGGATRVVHDNLRDLSVEFGDQFDFCVICTREGAEPYKISSHIEDDIPVWAIGTPDQHGTEMTPRDPRMAEVFGDLLDRINPTMVHFHCIQRLTASVVTATLERKLPYVITVHDGWWISPHQFILDPATDQLEFYDYASLHDPEASSRALSLWPALAGAQRVLAVSEPFAELHRACHVPNITTTENGVSRVPAVTRQPHPEGRVRLAHIGGTERHKGLPLLRQALISRDYQNLELLVIDHALAPGLVLHEVWGNTPVIRQGKLPQSEIGALYARIDVLIAPSLWPESYGLVTREALASGAWVLASDRGAVGGDVEEGVNGHIVDVSDSIGLADTLSRIDAAPETYRCPPETSPAIRSTKDQARELAEIYARVIAQTKSVKTKHT